MTTTINRMTAGRRIGVLAFTGVATALVGLGLSGNASAETLLPEIPFLPSTPGTPPPPSAAPLPELDPAAPQQLSYFPPPPGPADPAVPPQPWYLPPPPLPWEPPAGGASLGDSVSLNPQPLPPGPERGRRVSLNPQPLPPGPDRWRDSLMSLSGF
jgi:hypothetical protein